MKTKIDNSRTGGLKVVVVKMKVPVLMKGRKYESGEQTQMEYKRGMALVSRGTASVVEIAFRSNRDKVKLPKASAVIPNKPQKEKTNKKTKSNSSTSPAEPAKEKKASPPAKVVEKPKEDCFVCPKCPVEFDTMSGMKVHMARVHSETFSKWTKKNGSYGKWMANKAKE